MIDANTRLAIYRKALKDYKKSWLRPASVKMQLYTNSGFCSYFYNQKVYSSLESLPELENLHPVGYTYDGGYWYKPGKILPRIRILKKAIKAVKKLIK